MDTTKKYLLCEEDVIRIALDQLGNAPGRANTVIGTFVSQNISYLDNKELKLITEYRAELKSKEPKEPKEV